MKPKIIQTLHLPDDRGYNAILYDSTTPVDFHIVQINQAFSYRKHTLRGLHYQVPPYSQAKLCYCLAGRVYNVALDLETGEEYGEVLEPGKAMFIPRGYAHGYLTLEDNVLFQWCVDNDFNAASARVLNYRSVSWPVEPEIISEKDAAAEVWWKGIYKGNSEESNGLDNEINRNPHT